MPWLEVDREQAGGVDVFHPCERSVSVAAVLSPVDVRPAPRWWARIIAAACDADLQHSGPGLLEERAVHARSLLQLATSPVDGRVAGAVA